MNIDDMPVGKGNGSQSTTGYEDESNADSRFSSSGSNSRRKSPRGGKSEYHDDDVITSPSPHGQDSEVPYSSQDEEKNLGGLLEGMGADGVMVSPGR